MANEQPQQSPFINNSYLNGKPFKFQIYFWNHDGRVMKLLPGSIDELVIENNIYRWYHSGHIIFRNTKDVWERSTKKIIDKQEIDTLPYRFRNDGRDYIYIELDIPAEDDIKSSLSLDNEVHTIKLMFSVTEVGDVVSNEGEKYKKINFWDYRQQILSETNLCWATPHALKRQANNGLFKSTYLVDEPDVSLYTGDSIKDVITEALKTEKTTPQFEDDFSRGGEKIFYNSPTDSKAYDDISYILSLHTHDTNTKEPCILRCDRYTDKWSLLPISEFFKRAYIPADDGAGLPGEMCRDRFLIADESMINSEQPAFSNQARTSHFKTAMNNFWVPENTINTFEFHEASCIDCADIHNTSVVHLHNIGNKQFNVHLEESDIVNTREYIQKTVFSTMLGGEGGVFPSFVLNRTKTENRTYKSFSTPVATKCRESLEGRNRIIMDAILHGNMMKFNASGMPSRQAGVFIAVDRQGGFNDNEFDDKILGYHLTVSVKHIIKGSNYTNEIMTVKPYRWKDANFNEEQR